MSAERAQIINVKNDIIRVALPYLEGTINTYLTASVDATGTTLTVKDNSDLANNDYLILGQVGAEQTEIVKIGAAVSAGSSLTIGATVFAHPVGTKVTLVRYNQVEIYRSTSASDAAPTIIGSAVGLNVQLGYNELVATTTSTYYYARYKNAQTGVFSSYSDATLATGLSARARGEIKLEYLSAYNEQIDDLISDDWLNRTINRWQRELSKRKKQWSCLRSTSVTTTVQDKQGYTMSTDMQDTNTSDSSISVKFSDKGILKFVDQDTFLRLTRDHIGTTLAADIGLSDTSFTLTSSKDFASPTSPATATINIAGDSITYTTNTKSTNVLSGGAAVTATHTSGDEVWQNHTTGQPSHYTIDAGKIRLYPIPDSASANRNIHTEYWKKFTDLSDDADETAFLWPENCLTYLDWQVAIRRRLPSSDQLTRKAVFEGDLEKLVADDGDVKDVRISPVQYYNQIY